MGNYEKPKNTPKLQGIWGFMCGNGWCERCEFQANTTLYNINGKILGCEKSKWMGGVRRCRRVYMRFYDDVCVDSDFG
jgi:hypothetical protein